MDVTNCPCRQKKYINMDVDKKYIDMDVEKIYDGIKIYCERKECRIKCKIPLDFRSI